MSAQRGPELARRWLQKARETMKAAKETEGSRAPTDLPVE